jgi:heptosyltransferase-1
MRNGILVIQSLGLGDVFFAIPVLKALRHYYPDEPLTFLTNAQNAPLLAMVPEAGDVITYGKNPAALWKLVQQIKSRNFRMAVILNPILRGSLLAWAAGVPERIGYREDFEKKQSMFGLDRILLTHAYTPRWQKMQEAKRYLDILQMYGLKMDNKPQVKLVPADASIQYANSVFQKLQSGSKKPSVLINPGGNWDLKRWPAERFAAVADRLSGAGSVVFVGSKTDTAVVQQIRSQMKQESLDLSGQTSLGQLAGLLAHANLFISTDTGALHMAAALGTPTVALFGPSDPFKYEPMSDKVTVLHHEMSCSPCRFQYGNQCGRNLCMESISTAEVLQAAEKILGVILRPKAEESKILRSAQDDISKKRKILYLQSTSEIGGTDISLLRTLETLDKSRFEAHVVIPKEGPFTDAYRTCGAKIHYLPAMKKLTSRKGPGYLLSYLTGYFPAVFQLKMLIGREKIDLVHTNTLHNLYGFLAAKLAGKPHVWHVREIVVQSRWVRAVEIFLAKHFSTRIVVMDNAIAEAFWGWGSGFPRSLRKVYEGINLQKFHPSNSGAAVRKEQGIPEGAPLVGMISRLDPWKGPDVFLQTAAIVHKNFPSAHFLVCGGEIEGHEGLEARLKGMAQSLGIGNITHFTGWQYQNDRIPEVFRALDISVQCPVYPEPYGLVNIEAMASGIPVVAPALGGPLEICKDGETAILVLPQNPESAAGAVVTLLQDKENAKRMGLKGRERAETYFDMTRCIRDLEAVYAEILP